MFLLQSSKSIGICANTSYWFDLGVSGLSCLTWFGSLHPHLLWSLGRRWVTPPQHTLATTLHLWHHNAPCQWQLFTLTSQRTLSVKKMFTCDIDDAPCCTCDIITFQTWREKDDGGIVPSWCGVFFSPSFLSHSLPNPPSFLFLLPEQLSLKLVSMTVNCMKDN